MTMIGIAWLAVAPLLAWSASPGDRQPPPLPPEHTASGFEADRMVDEQWDRLDTHEVLYFIRRLNESLGDDLPHLSWESVRGIFRGEGFPYGIRELGLGMVNMLFRGVAENMALLGRLIVLAVLLALLSHVQSAFEADAVARTAYAVVYMGLIAVAMVSFHQAVGVAREVIETLMQFMLALLPLMIALLAGLGAFISAGLFHPFMVFSVHAVGLVMKDWVFPLIYLATVLEIANHFSLRVRLTRFAAVVRHAGVFVMTGAMMLFLAVMTVQGAAGSVADGVALRTVKFTAGAFIPVLGGMFADATELVVNAALILKNALGLLGAGAVVLFAVYPLIQVVSLVITFRLAAALVQPLGDGPFVDALQAMGNGMMLIGLATGAVVLMFFTAITVMVGVGNVAVMLR
ncbi:MAG: stage III sporulation protein AE [Thermaerobacterales bacterium]